MIRVAFFLAYGTLLSLVCSGYARGQAPDPNLPTLLAQVCYVEATWRTDDCAAIVHVLVKRAERAGVPLADMAVRYSAIDADTPRARQVRTFPAGLEPRQLAKWQRLEATAQGVLDGKVPNPCPRASHWGSPRLKSDVRRAMSALEAGRWTRAACRAPVANAFFADRAKP